MFSTLELMGLFWVILSTAVFTSAVLIGAGWAWLLGYRQLRTWIQVGRATEKMFANQDATR